MGRTQQTVRSGRAGAGKSPNQNYAKSAAFLAFRKEAENKTPEIDAYELDIRWKALTPEQKSAYIPKVVNRNSNLLGLYNVNNNLLKFPPREEELKGLFNTPAAPNKTRTRRRKNRKTLRKRR